MRLVEGVGGKRLPVRPDLLQLPNVVPLVCATRHEVRLHLVDDVLLLFAHGLPETVGLPLREACELLGQQHDLLLIDRDAIGLLQILLTGVQIISNRLSPVLARNKIRDVFHRPWTIQGVHGNQVLKHSWLQRFQVFLHSCRFILEYADGVTALEQLVGLGVVQRKAVRIEVYAMAKLDILHRVFDDGERLQPQEVHFQQACILGHSVVKLSARHDAVLRGCNGHEVGDVVWGYDHAASVDSRVANAAFEDAGGL